MRKIFTERERLVVYLEREEVARMLLAARASGNTLVEWARETLREKLAEKHRTQDVPRDKPVRVAERSTSAAKRVSASKEPCKHGADPEFCKHEECRR